MTIETRSVDFIPEEERYGRPSSLFYIWFGANMNVTTIAAGVLPVVLGLNLFWSAAAIVLGSLIGAVFMASHSAQGPKLGIPQMIQSRAQFGVVGAILPLLFVMLIYLGFFVSNTLLAAQAIEKVSPLGQRLSICTTSLACFVFALYGYRLIHRMQRTLSVASIAIFAIATLLAVGLPVPDSQWLPNSFSAQKFIAAVSVAVTWQLSYAPYVADYSRYLPSNTSAAKVFWHSYCGTVLGGAWMMVLGAILTVAIPSFADNVGSHVAQLFGVFAVLLYIFVVFGQVSINVFNLYGAFMSTVTMIEPFTKIKVTPRVRGAFMLGVAVVGTVLSMVNQNDFTEFFLNFIFFMSYFLIPWTAINLVDFYFVRRGVYSIEDIFDANGKYGRINWLACGTFMLAVALEIPFINTNLFVGPIARSLQGVDIAWLVGLAFPAVVYYVFSKKDQTQSTPAAMVVSG